MLDQTHQYNGSITLVGKFDAENMKSTCTRNFDVYVHAKNQLRF